MYLMEAVSMSDLVNSGLTDLVADAQTLITTNGPLVITVAGAFIGVNIAIKMFKRFGNKIG